MLSRLSNQLQESTNFLLAPRGDAKKGLWVWLFSLLSIVVLHHYFGLLLSVGIDIFRLGFVLEVLNAATTDELAGFDRQEILIGLIYRFAAIAAVFPAIWLTFQILELNTAKVVAPDRRIRWLHIVYMSFVPIGFSIIVSAAGTVFLGLEFPIAWSGRAEWLLVFCALPIIVIQATTEELIFRGYLVHLVGGITRSWWIIFLAVSGAFFVIHLFNPNVRSFGWEAVVDYLVAALLLTALAIRTGRLEYSIGLHIGINVSFLLFFDLSDTAYHLGLETYEGEFKYTFSLVGALVLLLPPCIFYSAAMLLHRRYKPKQSLA